MSSTNDHAATPNRKWLDHVKSVTDFAAAGDRQGQEWIEKIPSLVRELTGRWTLEVDERANWSGFHAVVLPVQQHGDLCVLKLTWPAERASDEVRALMAWDGRGAVRLLEADTSRGAMLLERLDARRTLYELDPLEAAVTAGRLLRRLAVPAPMGLPQLTDSLHSIASMLDARQELLGRPIPETLLNATRQAIRRLEAVTGNEYLVHGDLHYGNILAGVRESWLAIDPKPVAGDPEYAVPELLWRRASDVEGPKGIRQLFTVIVNSASLDDEKAHNWAIVRSVDYWLWGLEHQLTDDPKLCRRVVEALI